MSRKRMIDPTIWEDENFGRLTPQARLLFIGLFSNADDEGRIRANASYIRSTIFMYDDLSLKKIEELIVEVAQIMKSVVYYESNGLKFIQLSNWEEYQRQQKDRIQPSKLPPLADAKQVLSNCVADAKQVLTQYSIDKVSIDKDREKVTASPQYLKNIPQKDLEELLSKYEATPVQIREKADSLFNYCEGHGKKYSNYKAMLLNACLKDFGYRKEKRQMLSALVK